MQSSIMLKTKLQLNHMCACKLLAKRIIKMVAHLNMFYDGGQKELEVRLVCNILALDRFNLTETANAQFAPQRPTFKMHISKNWNIKQDSFLGGNITQRKTWKSLFKYLQSIQCSMDIGQIKMQRKCPHVETISD